MKPEFNVLLVEDSDVDVMLVRHTLLKHPDTGFRLFAIAATLAIGLQILGSGTVDAVILDLNLPDSAGLETFQKLHNKFPDVPVVIYTAQADEGPALQALREGAQDYMVKGEIRPRTLFRALRFAVERNAMLRALQADAFATREEQIAVAMETVRSVRESIQALLKDFANGQV